MVQFGSAIIYGAVLIIVIIRILWTYNKIILRQKTSWNLPRLNTKVIQIYKRTMYSEQNIQEVTVEYKNLKALVKSLAQKLLLTGINPENLTDDKIRTYKSSSNREMCGL